MVEGGQPATLRHWLVVAGATLLATVGGGTFLCFTFVNPAIAESFGVPLSQVMVYTSLVSVGGLPATALLGPWVLRRLGARVGLVGYGVWHAAMLLGLSSAAEVAGLYGFGFGLGLSFSAGLHMMAQYLVTTWFAVRRGSVLGAMMAVSAVGGVLAGAGMPPVVAAWGWQGAFRLLAVVSLVVMVAVGVLVRTDPADVGLLPVGVVRHRGDAPVVTLRLDGLPLAQALRTRELWLLAAAIVAYLAVQAIQQVITSVHVAAGLDRVGAGVLVSLLSVCLAGATLVVGVVNDRFGTVAALWLAAGCQAVAMVALAVARDLPGLAVATAVLAFGSSVPTVLLPIVVRSTFGPADYARLLGVVLSFVPVGLAVGAPLWALSYDVTGSYAPALGTAAGASLAAAALITWVLRSAPSLRAQAVAEPG